jgi:hypothetical protein
MVGQQVPLVTGYLVPQRKQGEVEVAAGQEVVGEAGEMLSGGVKVAGEGVWQAR